MTKRIIILTTILTAFFINSYSSGNFCYYSLKGFTGNKALLYSIRGSETKVIDTAYRQSTGAFVFMNINKYPAGMYKIYFNDSIYTEVIFNNEDILLETNVNNIIGNMTVKNSVENAILFSYWQYALITRDSITRLSFEKDKIEKTTYNSNHPRIKAIEKRIDYFNNELRHYVLNIAKEYPNNFAPKLLKSYLYADFEEYKKNHPKTKYKTEESFYYDHYFDNIDFSDERFINTKVLFVTISDYMKTFGNPANTKNYTGIIDQVMSKAKANKEVYKYCLNLFMITFEGSIWEDVTAYLIDKYYIPSGYYPPQMTAYYAGVSKKLKSLKPGNEAPNIIAKDINGNTQNMKEIKAKAKLIVFYASDCSHCQEALPGLIEIYNMYKDKGLEGFGIALDNNQRKWKSEIKKLNLNWINLSDLKGLESPLIKTYNISSTPTIIILNKDNIIMSKPKDMAEVHAVLLQLLNQ
jgi:peroxiredoxin